MAKESDSFAKNLAISVVTGLFTIGAEVAVAYLVPQVQNPILVNNNVVISADDYEKATYRIQELEDELNELKRVGLNSNNGGSSVSSAASDDSNRALLKDEPGSSFNYSRSDESTAKDTAGNRYEPSHWGIIGSCSACSGFADYYLGGTIPVCPLLSRHQAQILMERATLHRSKFLLNTKAIPISDAFILRKTLASRPLQFCLRT